MEPSILRGLILIAVFIAVLLVVETVISSARAARHSGQTINRRLELIGRGFSREEVLNRLRRATSKTIDLPWPFGGMVRQLEDGLTGAGLKVGAGTILFALVVAAVGIFVLVIGLAVVNAVVLTFSKVFLLATFAFAIGFGIPMMIFSRIADNRKKKLAQQFPVALDVFVRGLRAGHPIQSALELLTQEMSDPIGSEFGMVVDEVTYGADFRDALENMANRCSLEDMHMFVVSLSVQNETGGNLAEILENLTKVIRERATMLLMVRALSSEGRMTATILTLLPVLTFTGLFILNPKFYLDVSDDPVFIPGFTILLVLYAFGFWVIRRMIDLKV